MSFNGMTSLFCWKNMLLYFCVRMSLLLACYTLVYELHTHKRAKELDYFLSSYSQVNKRSALLILTIRELNKL